jgi:hypothetical protein
MQMMHSFDLSQFGKICAGVGTVLVAAGAAAVGVDWLVSPTDEQLINRVKKDCEIIINNNKDYVSLFKRMLSWHSYNSSVRYQVMSELSEAFLYEIARLYDSSHGQPFPALVIQDCATLEKDMKLLLQHIDDIHNQQFLTENQRYNLSIMRMLVEQIIGLQEELALLKDYIVKHTSYFSLAECGWSVNKTYGTDFELYDLHKYDQYRLLQKLDTLIYKKYNYNTFSYISYVEDVESTINRLLYARNRAAFNYVGMISWIDQCIEKLRFIRSMVENRYQLQMLERERVYLEQRVVIF